MAAPLTAVITAAALSGCGAGAGSAGDFDDREQAVAEAIGDFQQAAQRRDTTDICRNLLAPEMANRLADGSSCEREMDLAIRDIDAASISVTDVSISGTTAVARVQGPAGERSAGELELVKRGDRWLLADYASKPPAS